MKSNEKEKINFFKRPLNILIIAVIATALWGSAIPAIKIGYELFGITDSPVADKLLFAGIRFTLAGIFVIIFNCISHKRIVYPKKEDICGIAALGLVQTTLEYVFFYLSLVYLTGVKGSILNSVGNFFAVILTHFAFKDDKINCRKFIGCVLGFTGVVVCCFEEGLDLSFTFRGDGFILIAAFCFAAGSVITKKVTQGKDSVMITGWQLALGGLVLVAAGLACGGRLAVPDGRAFAMLIYLAILSSLAFSLWAQLLKHNPVSRISVYCFLNPLFGIVFSGLLLGENIFNLRTIASIVLVCVGIYIVNRRGKEE